MADGNNNRQTYTHSHNSNFNDHDTNPYSFHRPSLFTSSNSNSFTSRRPAANALPSFQLPLPPFQQPVQPQPPVPPFQQQVPTPPIDPSDYIGSRVAANDGISELPSGNSTGFNNNCFPHSQGVGFLSPDSSGSIPANSSNTLTSNTPGPQPVLMDSKYGRPPYSPPTPGYQGSQSPDGLPHHSYDNQFSLPAPGQRGGGHSSMQNGTLQNPILNTYSQGAQPSPTSTTTTTTAASDSYARPSSSPYYQSSPATSHPLSYPGFTTAAPAHSATGTTGAYSRGIPSYSPQSQNHSVPSSPMQAPPYSTRPYPNFPTLPTMAGPVLSNMSNPGGQMAIVGGVGGMPPGYHPGQHHFGQHAMYAAAPHNTHSDRPFKCETCKAGFNRNHDLKRHTKIHLAVKPFPCTYCEKSFSRKDALKRHRLVKGCGRGENDSHEGNDNSPPEEIKPEDDDIPVSMASVAALRA